ncbi:MAG TPA: c-type cytochrome [Blastocatellia bacterium]|nr:c-type cytochrome [Blastocatellia bacterium]
MKSKIMGVRSSMLAFGAGVAVFLVTAGPWLSVRAHEGHKHAPASARMLKNPTPPTAANISEGRAEYVQNCAPCHAEDGRGNADACSVKVKPADLTSLDVRALTDGEIFWEITHGIRTSGMPAFAAKSSPTQRWQIVDYIRQLPSSAQGTLTHYACPMHGEIRSDSPGKCPKCGMRMIAVK